MLSAFGLLISSLISRFYYTRAEAANAADTSSRFSCRWKWNKLPLISIAIFASVACVRIIREIKSTLVFISAKRLLATCRCGISWPLMPTSCLNFRHYSALSHRAFVFLFLQLLPQAKIRFSQHSQICLITTSPELLNINSIYFTSSISPYMIICFILPRDWFYASSP